MSRLRIVSRKLKLDSIEFVYTVCYGVDKFDRGRESLTFPAEDIEREVNEVGRHDQELVVRIRQLQ